MLESLNTILFSVFLFIGAWQDGKERSISIWLLSAAGSAGIFLSFLRDEWNLQRGLSCLIGAGLLLLSCLTDEAIGKGDGWFFVISGLFLNAILNLKLLIFGIFLNGIICGGIYLYGRLHGYNLKKKIGTVFTIFNSGMDRIGDVMREKLKGSYTVEAAFVMAIVLWVLLFSIQAAYRVHDEVIGAMALGESVERLCHSETEKPEEVELTAYQRAGRSFSWRKYKFGLRFSGNSITGKKVKAMGAGGNWKLSLEQKVFDPENFIRMVTLVNQEE